MFLLTLILILSKNSLKTLKKTKFAHNFFDLLR